MANSAIKGFEMTDAGYKKDFPIFDSEMNGQPVVYLDTAASAQKPHIVIDTMKTVMEEHYANIHRGLYAFSQETTEKFEAVRGKVQRFLNAKSEQEIVFTRNSTEAINLVAHSWGRQNLKEHDNIVLTKMEHHANIVPWQLLQKEIGFTIKTIELNDKGELNLDALPNLIDENTKFVGAVHISNATGVINPVKDIINVVKGHNTEIVTLVDASQSVVHGVVDVQDIGCDFLCFTGHKLYGPTGVGILYGRTEMLDAMTPYQGGGDMIETVSFDGTTFKTGAAKFEAGTPAIVDIIGLGAAIDYVSEIGPDAIMAHEHSLLEYTTDQMNALGDINIYCDLATRAGVISFNVGNAHSSDVGMILDQCGVAVRTGHHCCMPLMKELGADSTVRASFGIYNSITDCDMFIESLKKVKKLLL